MTAIPATTATTDRLRTTGRPLAGTVVERKGWILLALMSALMILIGVQTFASLDPRGSVIEGSGCCNGHSFDEVAPWAYDYANELFRYLGTYEVGTGLFCLVVVLVGLRTGRRWAWLVGLYVPVMFAIHGFVLGALPFDAITMGISILGLLLMVRPVFDRR